MILPAPTLHLRSPGPLVACHRTNLANVGHRPGKARFRFGVRSRGHLIFRQWIDDPEDAAELFERIKHAPPSWAPHPRDYPDALYCVDTVTFLTTTGTGTSYTRPADWNNTANYVEGLGAGSAVGGGGAAGGGGGAYARKNNVSLTGNATYDIGAANSGTDVRFIDTGAVARMVADSATASSATAGTAANSTGDIKYDGGNGGTGSLGGGGGGGAAGPSGAGTLGGNSNVNDGGAGGAANNGATAGGAGGTSGAAPGNGGNGTEWDATHGSGSGGGGAYRFNGNAGGNGGRYGGGAGAPGSGGPGPNGVAYQGLIVVTYTPAKFYSFGHAIF